MRNRVIKRFNKVLVLILCILFVVTKVESRLLKVYAIDKSVNVCVTLTDSEGQPVSDAIIKLIQKGTDGGADSEVENVAWMEVSGVYTANVTVDTDEDYFVTVVADSFQTISTEAKQLTTGTNEYNVTLKKVMDTITVNIIDSTDASVKVEGATVNLYKNGEAAVHYSAQTDNMGTVIFSGATFVEGVSYRVEVSKMGYVPFSTIYTIDAVSNIVPISLEHVTLKVNVLEGSIEASELVLKKYNAGTYEEVSNPNWILSGSSYITDNVSEGTAYKVEINKEGHYFFTNVDSVTISNNNSGNVLDISTKEFGSIRLDNMTVGSKVLLYKTEVSNENLIEELTLETTSYTFENLEEGSYIITQGSYRKSGSITVTSGSVTQKTKADLWNESELTIITIGTVPSVTYEGRAIGSKVSVLEGSQTAEKQELTISPAINTTIVGLIYYNGTSYESVISEKSNRAISLTDDGTQAFFGDEYLSADTEKVLYIITDKVITSNDITVQFGDDYNITSFEQSEVSVKVNGPFGNIAGAYTLSQALSNNPAVNEGIHSEFLESTNSGTFVGGKVNFINSSIGNYNYAFDFIVNIYLKTASQTLDTEKLEILQQMVCPTVSKSISVEITEVEIKFEGEHADIQLGAGVNLIQTNTSKRYIINNTTLNVLSVEGSHLFDQYSLNSDVVTFLSDTNGIITLNEGSNTLRLLRSTDGLQSAVYTFMVDTIKPTITEVKFAYKDNMSQAVTENYNYDESATINSFDNIEISITAGDVGQDIKKVELMVWGSTTGIAMREGAQPGVYEYTLTTTDNRVNYFIRVTDEAGNATDTAVFMLSIDRLAPAYSSVSYNGLKLIDGVYYGGSNAGITVSFTDSHQNLSPTGVYCSVPCSTSFSADGSTVVVTISLGNGEYSGITVSCEDSAGQRSNTVTLDNIIVDSVAPVVNVSLSSSSAAVENEGMLFYRGTVTANVTVTDEAINETSISSSLGKTLSSNGTEVISADGIYTYSVSATDMCGNSGTSTAYTFTIDTQSPVATLTFDNNDLINEKYYNRARVATFTVKDVNFDPASSIVTVESTREKPIISQWESIGNSTYQATVTFATDAEYVLMFECIDRAGNSSNIIETQRFVIDTTTPVIEVVYDNNNVINGMYYNDVRVATITITEHNFVSDAVNLALTASDGSVPVVSDWNTSGDVHTAKVKFDTDGIYSMQIEYTDVADNEATPYVLERFIIDTTVPLLEIYGVENNSANNDVVQPGIRYSDINLSADIVIKLVRSSGEEVDYAKYQIEEDGIINILFDDFVKSKDVDDIYTLSVLVEDMAGNYISDSIVFSVNRFGSNYYIDETVESMLGQVLTDAKTIKVTEVNVDLLEESIISYSLNGNIVELVQGTDYNVEIAGSSNAWKSYTYIINADNFSQEGNYVLTLYSKDKAQNIQDNKVKGYDIEFIIDKTAPSIVVSNVKDEGQYTMDSKFVSLDIQDNLGVKEVVVIVDDKVYAIFDKEDLAEEYGVVNFEIGDSSSWQTIVVSAEDEAGNKIMSESLRILVTSNVFVQWYKNVPLMIGTIAGAAIIVIGSAIGIVVLRRRKIVKK